MTQVIISLAPTSALGPGRHNPIVPAELVATARQCEAAGAAVIHLHARDADGNLSTDMGLLRETFAGISDQTSMIIEASTGGLSDFTAVQRGLPLGVPGATLGSLNLGSLNFGDAVYRNTPPDVDIWLEQMGRTTVKPSLEIFDTGHLAFAKALIDQGRVTPPYNFSFIFNVKWGMVFSEPLLRYLVAQLPAQSNWGVIFAGSQDFNDHLAAAQLGADMIRVGFEDSTICQGVPAADNRILVEELRTMLEAHGFSILQADAARKKLLDITA